MGRETQAKEKVRMELELHRQLTSPSTTFNRWTKSNRNKTHQCKQIIKCLANPVELQATWSSMVQEVKAAKIKSSATQQSSRNPSEPLKDLFRAASKK